MSKTLASLQNSMKWLSPLVLVGLWMALGMQPVAAQTEDAVGGEPVILTRAPATLYTDRANPLAVERIILRVPARAEPRSESSPEGRRPAPVSDAVTFSVWRVRGQAGDSVAPVYMLPDWSPRGLGGRAALTELLAAAAVLGPDADIYIVEPRGMTFGADVADMAGVAGGSITDFGCPGTPTAALTRVVARDELVQVTADHLRDCMVWWQEAGMDVPAYTLEAMARDVLAVAGLLGHDDIHAVGVGMGAFVALHAAQADASPLARAILVRPPGVRYPVIQPSGLADLVGALARRAAVAPTLYELVPDLEGMLAQVAERLAATPVAATILDPATNRAQVVAVGQEDLQMALGEALAAGDADAVPRRVFEMSLGNFAWLGDSTLARRRNVAYDLAAVAALCHAAPTGETLEQVQAAAEETALGLGAFQLQGAACGSVRAVMAAGAGEPASVDYDAIEIPLLFITGTLDGRTSNLELNALATEQLLVDDLLIENWTGRLDAGFARVATPIVRDFLADDYEAIPLVSTELTFEALTARPFNLGAWQADYYANRDLAGDPVLSRSDARIDFAWGEADPDPSLAGDAFSARWSQQVELPAGNYRFYVWSDDGARLWIDNVLVLDAWQEGPLRAYAADVNLVRGTHDIRYEYFDAGGNALARLRAAYVTAYADWVAAYYPNVELAGDPVVVRNEQTPNVFWGTNSPAPSVPAGNFSARWTTQQDLAPGAYAFRITASGGVRLYVNDELVIDAWENVGRRLLEANHLIEGSAPTELRVETFVVGGGAELNVRWQRRAAPVGPQLGVRGPTRAATGEALELAVDIVPEGGRQAETILWDMGDSTQYSTEEIVHTYAAPGIYDITVLVTDTGGIATGLSRQIRVDPEAVAPETERSPLAAFAAPTVVDVGDVVTFDAGASLGLNPLLTYRWEFGDGSDSQAAWVQKVYQEPGVYNVRLRIADDQGMQARLNQLVLVLAQPSERLPLRAPVPELAFDIPAPPVTVTPISEEPAPGEAPEAVVIAAVGGQSVLFESGDDGALVTTLNVNQPIVLDARSSIAVSEDSPVTGYIWDIADGFSTANDAVVELVFSAPGAYNVRLTVTDADGRTATRRIVLNVVE